MNQSNQIYPWLKKYLNLINKERLSHAYLISGRDGLGKKNLAELMAKKILCKETSSDNCKCQSCRLFDSSNHPDFHLIEKEEKKKQISINQIRACFEYLFESSFLNGNRLFLIYPAEIMTPEAADSALKILEEPPKNSYFILVSHRSKQLPPTIRSRCSEIKVSLPSQEQIENWLQKETVNDKELRLALSLSKGRPLKATELISQSVEEIRKIFIKDISRVIKQGDNIIKVSENWAKDLESLITKLEWMGDLLRDALRHHFFKELKNTTTDTDHISTYLGKKVEDQTLFLLLEETNKVLSWFSNGTNLRADYQLQSLFITWNSELAISS